MAHRHSIHTVKSVSEFVALLEDLFPDTDDILFRGQREDWPLLPKVARIKLREGKNLPAVELKMLTDFKLQAPSLVDILPKSNWEWLSLAQHYGMATRLLDWTSNPLAALWFAVEKPAELIRPAKVSNRPAVVWAFNPRRGDFADNSSGSSPYSGPRTQIFRPKQIARRIIAQSGWFTVHKYIHDQERFVPLDHQPRYKKSLTKILVPPERFSDIRYGLDRCGVHAASMLTDLGGLCGHIEWLHSLLEDELEDGKANHVLQRVSMKRPR